MVLTVPVGDVLVCDTRGNVEHDDTALAIDVVSIAKTTELFLPSSVPYVELNLAQVLLCVSVSTIADKESSWAYRGEAEWVNFDTECSNILLLELASQMTLDEGGL